MVTILVPMRNEEGFIEACLASLRAQDYPATHTEILVLDGESTDHSRAIVAAIAEDDPCVRLMLNPGRTQAAGLNIGIHEARGEIIVRADAHATYGPAYVSTCVRHLAERRADNVGGAQRGAGTTPFTRALAVALRTPLGAGNAPYRLATEPRYADTVWLGSWWKQTLIDIGGVNESLIANEDYEMNCRLRKRGGRILFDPSLESTYYPRPSLLRLWRQYFRYGIGKVQTLRLHPDTLALRQAVPPLFTLGLLLTLSLLPLSPLPLSIYLGVYALGILAGSTQAATRYGWAHLPYLLVIYPAIHLAWGTGFLWEILRHGPFPLNPNGLYRSERLVQKGE